MTQNVNARYIKQVNKTKTIIPQNIIKLKNNIKKKRKDLSILKENLNHKKTVRQTADFPAATVGDKQEWNIFKMVKHFLSIENHKTLLQE